MTPNELRAAAKILAAVDKLEKELQRLTDPAPHWWEITRNNGDRLRLFSSNEEYKIVKDAVVMVRTNRLNEYKRQLHDLGVDIKR